MKKPLQNDDRILKAASLKYFEALGSRIPPEAELRENITLSPEFDARMLDSIRREQAVGRSGRARNRRRMLRVLLAAALLVALLLSVWCMTLASRYRSAEMTLSSNVSEDGTAGILFRFESTEELQNRKEEIEKYMVPAELPEGFQERKDFSRKNPFQLVKYYERGEEILSYEQNAIGICTFRVHADNAGQKDVMINACHGILIRKHNGNYELVWNDGANVFYLEGSLSEEEIMRVALSLKRAP